ncbi:MAG: bifunctional folylpolyglutamate synthase/dihydrofolate synthase [Anaerolineae bacterium]
MKSYRHALELIFQRANFERQAQPPYTERVYRLERMRELLQAVGNPQMNYQSVHIAGTKGKGSVTALTESILRAAGYRTGMYTSPHLHTFRERIRVMGQPATEEQICIWMERLDEALTARPEVTVFEAITALAMIGFSESGVQVGVFEVGMGGRLDATNILQPLVSVITPVSLDHMNVLGNTIAAIAYEKAGIIKPDTPVVSSPQTDEALQVIRQTCAQRNALLSYVPDSWHWQLCSADLWHQTFTLTHSNAETGLSLQIPLLGEHQLENAATAVATIAVLRDRGYSVSDQAVQTGLRSVVWPGRMEVLGQNPLVVLDGAHNGHSIERLLVALRAYLHYNKVILIFGVSSTHTPLDLLGAIAAVADSLILTQSIHSKAHPVADLAAFASSLGYQPQTGSTVTQSLEMALSQAHPDDLILVTGSLFVVAEARAAWMVHNGTPPPPGDPEGIY